MVSGGRRHGSRFTRKSSLQGPGLARRAGPANRGCGQYLPLPDIDDERAGWKEREIPLGNGILTIVQKCSNVGHERG